MTGTATVGGLGLIPQLCTPTGHCAQGRAEDKKEPKPKDQAPSRPRGLALAGGQSGHHGNVHRPPVWLPHVPESQRFCLQSVHLEEALDVKEQNVFHFISVLVTSVLPSLRSHLQVTGTAQGPLSGRLCAGPTPALFEVFEGLRQSP